MFIQKVEAVCCYIAYISAELEIKRKITDLVFYLDLTPWSRVLENLIILCSASQEPEGSLPRSQVPATSPCLEPDESSPHLSTLLP
jgi:hypothetical protein